MCNFLIIKKIFFLIKKKLKITHVASTCALTWLKLVWGAKTAKGAIFRGGFVFYFVRGPKSQLLET